MSAERLAGAAHTVSKDWCRNPLELAAPHSCWWRGVAEAGYGAAPPWVADQALKLGGVLPIGPERLGQGGLKVVQGVEDCVGEDPAQRLEPALRRVELGAVGWQRDLRDALGPAD